MRILWLVLLTTLSGSVIAQQHADHHRDHDIVFNSAGQLLTWCEQETRAHYAGKGLATYQWTGRHFEDGNTLHAEGRIRVDGNDVPVSCRAARGARERDAVIELAS